MRCGRAQRYISEYVDGTLSPERQDWLKRHIDRCADCRRLLQDFQAMAREAQSFERLSPPDETWLKIRAGVREARAREAEAARRARTKAPVFGPVFVRPRLVPAFAAAAVVVLVAATGILYFQPWHTAVSADKAAVDSFTLVKLDEAEKYYEQSVKSLNEALAAQKGILDPEVKKAFETNLTLVDASIKTCQQAVRRDPRDLEAQYALLDSYKEKVQLMTGLIMARREPGQNEPSGVGL